MKKSSPPVFIDLFAGCGGISLGLCQAGWQGLFAVEKTDDAFKTFKANFLSPKSRFKFAWPNWLGAPKAHGIDEVIEQFRAQLKELRGSVDLIAGGPPCQGFSFAGRRQANDPRNKLFRRYVEFVKLVEPKFLLLENVPGMGVSLKGRRATALDQLMGALADIGYSVDFKLLNSAEFGVPQRRKRLVVVGARSELGIDPSAVFARVAKLASPYSIVTAEDAIGDLSTVDRKLIDYTHGSVARRHKQLQYAGPESAYQISMNCGVLPEDMDSMRLPNHSARVRERFDEVLDTCARGVNIAEDDRRRLGMLKHRQVPMDPAQPAPTLTTLPDDILHYGEPRILTVRECARLQSFPDWFVFKGNYTTGGLRRKSECPRYTQVGNAVPPALAMNVGKAIAELRQALRPGKRPVAHSPG